MFIYLVCAASYGSSGHCLQRGRLSFAGWIPFASRSALCSERQQAQSRSGRQQSRSGRQQQREDKKRGCKPEDVLRKGLKPQSKGDNADGSRQDAHNNAAAPVLRSSSEDKSLETACEERRKCGDLFLLLHLLEPLRVV